jgi:hypothetical protein
MFRRGSSLSNSSSSNNNSSSSSSRPPSSSNSNSPSSACTQSLPSRTRQRSRTRCPSWPSPRLKTQPRQPSTASEKFNSSKASRFKSILLIRPNRIVKSLSTTMPLRSLLIRMNPHSLSRSQGTSPLSTRSRTSKTRFTRTKTRATLKATRPLPQSAPEFLLSAFARLLKKVSDVSKISSLEIPIIRVLLSPLTPEAQCLASAPRDMGPMAWI